MWASGILPPKQRHVLGCLIFSDFFLLKKNPTSVKSHFENTIGTPFFEAPFFFFFDKTLHKKISNSNYIGLDWKTAFRINFEPWEVPKLKKKLHFHFHAFSGWGTSRGQKLILKAVFKSSPVKIWSILSQKWHVKK